MSKGGYRGGSTVVGRGSGWFTSTPPTKRPESRAARVGRAVTAAREQERADWNGAEHPAEVLSASELAARLGPPPARTQPTTSDAGAKLKRARAQVRQREKRQRLGIED